jgi:23S rRNA pseudouridine2605 synthase
MSTLSTLEANSLKGALEALLLVSSDPVSAPALAGALDIAPGECASLLAELKVEYEEANRGFQLREVAGGWRLFTHPAYHDVVEAYVLSWDTQKLSQAALETLAVIAYHQPVTREVVKGIRGVNSDGVIASLVDKGLVRELGRDPQRGQAIIYGTTNAFLEKFGLRSTRDLPDLEQFAPDEQSRQFIRERLSGRSIQSTLEEQAEDLDEERELLDTDVEDVEAVENLETLVVDEISEDLHDETNEVGETRAGAAVPNADTHESDAQPVYPHTMRLQRFLARAGVASRRGSEDLMTAGRVTVNGQVATELGTKVDVDRDHIEVDGMPVKLNQGAVYLMLYKPTGYLTTMSDPQERPCVADLVPRDRYPGLFPVGRLDRDTTGLLLFTTDGDLSQDLLHPSKHVYKTYQALVDGHLTDRDLGPLRRGIELDDGLCQPAICRVINAREAEAVTPQGVKPGTTAVEVIIREGRKNQVKRMLSKIHHPVIRLHRCNFAGLELEGVAKGSWRELTDREVQILKDGGIPPKQASSKRSAAPATNTASRTRHHGSHGSAPKRNTYRERYTS